MTSFNDSIRETLRLNRLRAIHDRIMNGPVPTKYPDDYKSVFEPIDFIMIESMWDDYAYSSHSFKKAHELAPDHIVKFVHASQEAAGKLNTVHLKWRQIANDLNMDDSRRRLSYKQLRDEHKSAAQLACKVKNFLPKLTYGDNLFIVRPIEIPVKNRKCDFVLHDEYELSRRYPWYYVFRDKFAANIKPDIGHALLLLILWQIESHLGLPERTYQDTYEWYPVFRA